jgi:hypothetical protein
MPPTLIRAEPLESRSEGSPDGHVLAPIVGFRNWRILRSGPSAGELSSPYVPVVWHQRALRAECRRFRSAEELLRAPHAAPEPGCVCGICAYRTPTVDFSRVDFQGVSGIVTVWGSIVVDLGGVRAEHARVEALGLYSRWSRRQKSSVRRVADTLGVDLVALEDLGAAASQYGVTLTAALSDEGS